MRAYLGAEVLDAFVSTQICFRMKKRAVPQSSRSNGGLWKLTDTSVVVSSENSVGLKMEGPGLCNNTHPCVY